MSWSLVISKYPKSILKNDRAIKILICLEKYGISTEKEIQDYLHFENEVVTNLLHDLKLNELIDYSEETVHLTAKGMQLLDRFELSTDILDDNISHLERDLEKKESILKIYSYLRKEHPKRYQDSIFTLRKWSDLVKNFGNRKVFGLNQDEIIGSVKCLMYKDLREYSLNLWDNNALFHNIHHDIRTIIFIKQPQLDKYCYDDSSESFAVKYLSILDNDCTISHINKDELEIKLILHDVLLKFNNVRHNKDIDQWIKFSNTMHHSLPQTKGYRNASIYAGKLSNYFEKELIRNNVHQSVDVDILRLRKKASLLNKNINYYDLMLNLMSSLNLDEFCNLTNLDKESAKSLIINIKEKCEELISTKKKAKFNY